MYFRLDEMKTLLIISILLSIAQAFAPLGSSSIGTKALQASRQGDHDIERIVATSAVAATFILSSTLSAGAALALSDNTSLMLAARSGGRGGGRAVMRSAPSSSRVYSRTTIIAPPRPIISAPIVVSPFGAGVGYGYGYGYNPLGGFGLGYGLGAMNSIGDTVRDYRQESEIQRDRAELEVAKEKQQELEARIRELEKSTSDAKQ
jgi:hypothetical protein